MKGLAWTYLSVLVVFVGLDALWLSLVGGAFYRREAGALLLDRPVWPAVAAFYVVYAAGLALLAVPTAPTAWLHALSQGALFGLCAYAAYDLTNLAVLRGWTLRLALVDLAWGTASSAVASLAGWFVRSRLND